MLIIFEISRPMCKDPRSWRTDEEFGFGWLWFAVRFVKKEYVELVMNAHDFIMDGHRYTSLRELRRRDA